MLGHRTIAAALLWAALDGSLTVAGAQTAYDPGASDTEIRIGNLMPYSGPASAYGAIGKAEAAYFDKINAEGGINGRRIKFTSYDDAYSPPKAVELMRKLVEGDEVLFVFNTLGTPGNTAIQRFLNQKQVPQLFVATGLTRFGDQKNFAWTIGWQPSYQTEARVYASYILRQRPGGKIAVLYQNDDYGRDYLKGLRDGLGARANMIVAQEGYEVSEPTIDSRILTLRGSGADVLVDIATPKFAAQAIRKVSEIGWKPLHILNNVSASIGAVIKPAGFEAAQGIVSAAYLKDPTDPQWKNAPDMKAYGEFLDKYHKTADRTDSANVYAYNVARTLVQVLRQCGDNLTRANVMKQAASLRNFEPGTLLPGILVNTAPDDFYPIEQLQLMRLNGASWQLFGDVMTGELAERSRQPMVVTAPTASPASTPMSPSPATPSTLAATPSPRPLTVPGTAVTLSRRVALVIGNSAYQNAPALPNPRRDATTVAEALRGVGFQSVTLQTDLSREQLISALRVFARQAEGADWAVVYYAGHGIEIGGINYLIPIDAKISTDRDAALEAVPIDQVLNSAERASRLRLILLDACRDNPFLNQMKRTLTVASRSVSRGLAQVEPDPGTLVVFAAKHGETALDGDGVNSPFATAFVRNLQTPGLEVRRMFDFVRDDVMDATNRRQQPYSYGSVPGRQDFYFVGGR